MYAISCRPPTQPTTNDYPLHVAKDKFTQLTSTAVPLPVENIDTDQIIPARFLKATTREGFGDNLFRDWRFAAKEGVEVPNADFVLNQSGYKGKILIAGKNFGCGSGREHAAWALYDYGFRVVISSFFADIFQNNALNNALLPIVVEEVVLQDLLNQVQQNPELELSVDLPAQQLRWGRHAVEFDINPYKKICLMNGYDDIDYLLSLRDDIRQFDQTQVIYG